MRNSEFFASRLEQEIPAFVKVLRALPPDKLDYKPHEKNTCAGDLAWQMATEIRCLSEMFDTGVVDYRVGDEKPPVDEIANIFERSANIVIERAKGTNEDLWSGPAKFLYNGHVAWETTASDMAWGFLFDLVHHRGQLSAYLRPMGGKVPSIYGPSADDQPGAG